MSDVTLLHVIAFGAGWQLALERARGRFLEALAAQQRAIVEGAHP